MQAAPLTRPEPFRAVMATLAAQKGSNGKWKGMAAQLMGTPAGFMVSPSLTTLLALGKPTRLKLHWLIKAPTLVLSSAKPFCFQNRFEKDATCNVGKPKGVRSRTLEPCKMANQFDSQGNAHFLFWKGYPPPLPGQVQP